MMNVNSEVATPTDDEIWHRRGEFVLGLGWSCVGCDSFYCPVVNAPDFQPTDLNQPSPGDLWVKTGWIGGPQSCREWNPPRVAIDQHTEHVPAGHPDWRHKEKG